MGTGESEEIGQKKPSPPSIHISTIAVFGLPSEKYLHVLYTTEDGVQISYAHNPRTKDMIAATF